jgi:hypothetical protein
VSCADAAVDATVIAAAARDNKIDLACFTVAPWRSAVPPTSYAAQELDTYSY